MTTADKPIWTGAYLSDTLGVRIHSDSSGLVAVEDLVGLALRRNPKRAHLLVSRVLAKHVPTEPNLVIAAGELLGVLAGQTALRLSGGAGPSESQLDIVAQSLIRVLRLPTGQRREEIEILLRGVRSLLVAVPQAIVIGYAETATGLGRLVANSLGAYYIHSTRHSTPGVDPAGFFEEGHSHATSHAIVPTDTRWLDSNGPVVLVDDELSTGATVINTIRELQTLRPRAMYVVASLIDLRSDRDRNRFAALESELGCRISVVALGTGRIDLGEDILGRATSLIDNLPTENASSSNSTNGCISIVEPAGTNIHPVRSDRFGNLEAPSSETIRAVAVQVANTLSDLGSSGDLAVVGCEENMYLPLAVAQKLEEILPQRTVLFSTTTRSPIVAIDRDDYAIATASSFASHDLVNDGPGRRFAYNLGGSHKSTQTLVVFPEPGTEQTALQESHVEGLPPMLTALSAHSEVLAVLLPALYPVAVPNNFREDHS